MVDRSIVFTGQIPLDTDILIPQRNTMIGIGALAQAVIGEQSASPAVAVDGFVLSAAGPPSLIINVAPGSIYAPGVVDQNAYGSLPADITNTITLQGIALGTTALTFTPPGTGGFATNYLVQVALATQDGTPIVLPYYNASNPTVPWLGPNNTGVSQNTKRQCLALVQAKAGIAALAGAQITPAPDPGFYGLYAVTVASGATALTSGNWTTLSTAPFIPAPLMAIPQAVQSGKWIYNPDTGTANALVVTLAPAPLALIPGLEVRVKKIASANTSAATLVVNGSAAIPITTITGAALIGSEMPASSMLDFVYDGAAFQLQSAVSPSQASQMHYGIDAGTANAISVPSVSPPVASVTQGMHFTIRKGAASSSGPLTAAIAGTTAAVTWPDGTAFVVGGEWRANAPGLVVYENGTYKLLSPTTPYSFYIPGTPFPLFAPQAYFVNATTGSDSNSGLSAGNAFLTIQKAINVTQSLNMNGFNVTINVDGSVPQTYAPFIGSTLNGSGNVFIVGNNTTPGNALVHATTGEAILIGGQGYNLSGLAVQADANGSAPHAGDGLRVTGGTCFIQNMSFGACSTAHIATDPAGTVVCHGVGDGVPAAYINITGNALYHIASQGEVEIGQTILNITGARTVTAFWYGTNRGLIDSPYSAINFISGATVVGARYSATANSVLNTAGAGASYLPGNSAGSTATGGQYL